MRHRIEFAPSYTLLTIELEPRESVKVEPGAMVAPTGVAMSTGMGGGFLKGVRRMMGGESFFVNTFTGESGGGWVSLAPPAPGDIGVFDLEPGRNLFIQSSSFLACSPQVETDSKFQGFRGLFSGESLFFLRAYSDSSEGKVFYNSYGAIKELTVTPERELVVDTGHLVAFSDDVEYSVGKVGGIGSLVAGGEGLVMRFSGNGRVWVQTRNLGSLADKLIPFIPQRGK